MAPFMLFRSSKRKKKDKDEHKNPYSERGLDKFAAVMADVEAKKEKMMSEMNKTQEAPLIQFHVRSGSTELVPLVVKRRNRKPFKSTEVSNNNLPQENPHQGKLKPDCSRWRTFVLVILVLVFLVMFGLSFATICISMSWYVMPILRYEGSMLRRYMMDCGWCRYLNAS